MSQWGLNGLVFRLQHRVYAPPPRLRAMSYKVALLTLVLVSSTLAGCTSDPDGGGNDEIDAETLQNLQDFINSTMETEWINDRGDSSQLWEISLEDDQWLEVKSVVTVINYEGEDSQVGSFVRSEEGFEVVEGFSPIFGGDYSWCTIDYGSELPCANEDPDGDWVVVEWTIIYRIH